MILPAPIVALLIVAIIVAVAWYGLATADRVFDAQQQQQQEDQANARKR